MNSSAKNRQFERNFTSKQIGVPAEDLRDHYKNLQRQKIDTSNNKIWGYPFDDFKKGRSIWISNIDGSISVDKDTVFPKNKMTLSEDHPIVKEMYENGDMFRLIFQNVFDDNKPCIIRGQGKKIYVNGKCIFPQKELK